MPHHRDQEGRVDVPAREHDRDRAASGADPIGEEGSHADRSGTLDDELRALEQQDDRLADLIVRHGDDVVTGTIEDRHRQLSGLLDRDSVGDREARAARQRACGLYADHTRARTACLDRERDARAEPSAADRHDHRLDVVELVDELEADRALARDHDLVLERVHERRTALLDVLPRGVQRILEDRADEAHLRPVVPGRVDLRHRGVLRDEDRRRCAELAGGPRDRLAVIPRAGGNDALPTLGVGQRRELVDGPADLERARPLEVLRLQLHVAAAALRERLGAVDRRDACMR